MYSITKRNNKFLTAIVFDCSINNKNKCIY